jgi:hypothetical protein
LEALDPGFRRDDEGWIPAVAGVGDQLEAFFTQYDIVATTEDIHLGATEAELLEERFNDLPGDQPDQEHDHRCP